MNLENHSKQAKELYDKALQEFKRARDEGDGTLLRDACAKGWLSAIEATNAYLIKKGVREEELPQADRGRRYMIHKYMERELRFIYLSLREALHIEGYYEGGLTFEQVETYLQDLKIYIEKIEGQNERLTQKEVR